LIILEHVSYRYSHSFLLLEDINLNLILGETMALTGPNGVGKSTTLRLMAGLLYPLTGKISLEGKDSRCWQAEQRLAIGYLASDLPLYQDLTIKEYLNALAGFRAIPKVDRTRSIEEMITAFDLSSHYHSKLGQLSRGTQQRVALAQVFLHKPKIVILDEPSQGLDTQHKTQWLAWFQQYKLQCASILSSHDRTEIQSIADKVTLLENAKLLPLEYPTDALTNQNSYILWTQAQQGHTDATDSRHCS